jgi:hypothetical protein
MHASDGYPDRVYCGVQLKAKDQQHTVMTAFSHADVASVGPVIHKQHIIGPL